MEEAIVALWNLGFYLVCNLPFVWLFKENFEILIIIGFRFWTFQYYYYYYHQGINLTVLLLYAECYIWDYTCVWIVDIQLEFQLNVDSLLWAFPGLNT